MNRFLSLRLRDAFRNAFALASIVLCTAVSAGDQTASIPKGFLGYPPYNGFAFEARRLLPPRHDNLEALDGPGRMTFDNESLYVDWDKYQARMKQADLQGIPTELMPEYRSMKAAESGDAAFEIGKDLPIAVRIYTAAGVDFRIAHPHVVLLFSSTEHDAPSQGPLDTEQREALTRALGRFQEVLALAEADRRPRAVAATYMLARCYALRGLPGDASLAEKAFVTTRSLARAGLPDPLGLAVASFGDQAHLRRIHGDVASAVGLYAEQAVRGSELGLSSLKWVAQALYADPKSMSLAQHQPLVQRLIITYALEVNDDGRLRDYVYSPGTHPLIYGDLGRPEAIAPILEAAKSWPMASIAAPDRLAALAFRAGDVAFSRRLLQGQESALAWWLRAKISIGDGRLGDAEEEYVRAKDATDADVESKNLSQFNAEGICVELTQLERARGEFAKAMTDMRVCSDHYLAFPSGDDEYLADNVLTTDEYKASVDTYKSAGGQWANDQLYRSILANRLIREGRLHEALPYAAPTKAYFDPLSFDRGTERWKTDRDLIGAYVAAHDQISSAASTDVQKAEAWYRIALLTRVYYEAILGFDTPDREGGPKPAYPGVTAEEIDRLKKNDLVPHSRKLHWFAAYDDAMKAAQLVPSRSQAYAAILCHADRWMRQAPGRDGPSLSYIDPYRLYVTHGAYVPWASRFGYGCPEPDFSSAAQPSWRRELTSFATRVRRHRALVAIFVLGVMSALAIWAGIVIRRQRQLGS